MKKIFSFLFTIILFLSANAQTDSLQQYAGKFKFPEGSPVTEITMTVENGLLMAGSAMGSTEFKPTGTADVFEVVAYSGTATFRRTEGKITGVQIVVGDVNIEGTKTEGLSVTSFYSGGLVFRKPY